MSDQNNPPAFPVVVPELWHHVETGMSLRDWFAGQALAGRMINGFASAADKSIHAHVSYEIADAMLVERAKGGAA
jgi:hypothetical protein